MSYANQITHLLNETDHCYPCYSPCDTYCILIYSPPPPPPPPSLSSHHHQNLSLLFFIIIAILSLLFLIVSYYTILSKYCFIRNRSPTRPQTQIQQTHEQFLDENHPSVVDHPIWFIKTVGLDQSTINSITVITYKKQDRLVEGTDCSVCLSEFEEDEELRLLPKCSHAFHLPCIDTWLRSHKNCPMCRAPIVSVVNPVVDSTTAASGEENLVDGGVIGSDDHRGESVEERELMDGLTQLNTGNESSSLPDKEYALQVFGEMSERDGLQPVRRSVSMSYPILSHSILVPLEGELSSPTAQLVGEKNPRQLASSSSSGRLLHKGAVSMKRSFSSSAKFFSARSNRRQGSILPL